MFKSIRSSLLMLAASAVMALSACAGAPTATGVQAIQNACALDAGLRPTVTLLIAFATPQEAAAVTAARAVIDPVCANPSGTYEANTVAAVSGAAGQILAVVTELKARQGKSPTPAPAASAVVSVAVIPRVTA